MLLPMLANAQMNLAGRVYHKDYNILSDLTKLYVVPDREGEELAFKEKELNKSIIAANKAIIAYVTIKFIDDKKMKFQVVMRYDDSRAMANGISPTVREIMKNFRNVSRTVKGEYIMNGRTITLQDKKMKKYDEKLRFELSEDGETLTYVPKFAREDIPRTK